MALPVSSVFFSPYILVTLSTVAVAFDVHIKEIFVPLSLGMVLLSAPRSILLENLPCYISLLGVTHIGLVPSLIDATMGTVQEDVSTSGTTLRYIASGGEKISDSVSVFVTIFYGS